MTVTMEKTGANEAKLTITIEKEAYLDAMEKAYLKVRNQVNIPGFRKGKAPRQIIESYYSEAVFYDEACNIAIPEAYDKAIDEQGLFAVDQPEIDIVDIGRDTGIVFTAVVTLKPEVKLGQYKGLQAEKTEYPVTDEDIEAELKSAQDRVARWVEVTDRPIENGDRIMLDYSGFSDGEMFPGGTAENQPLEIGSGRFIPGFEEQLVGMKLGDEGEIKIKFPEEYHAPELAGKDAVFLVKIREIKGKQVPEIDDEFAKDVSEFDTLAEYKDSIRAKLEESNKQRTQNEFEEKLIELATGNATIEIPHVMVHRQAERMLRDFELRLSYQGLRMQDYLAMVGQTREALLEQNEGEAERTVRTSLVMEQIQKEENIEATDEDVEAEIEKLATGRNQKAEDLKKTFGEEDNQYLKDNIIMQKTVKFLSENAEEAAPAPKKKTTRKAPAKGE